MLSKTLIERVQRIITEYENQNKQTEKDKKHYEANRSVSRHSGLRSLIMSPLGHRPEDPTPVSQLADLNRYLTQGGQVWPKQLFQSQQQQ